MSSLSHTHFTTSGTWQVPESITNIIVIGCGGGGGGGCADDDFLAGGAGGGGAIQHVSFITVTPLTTYTITVGAGGAGGIVGQTQNEFCGQDGYSTIFSINGTNLFVAPGGGGAGVNNSDGFNHGGLPWPNAIGNYSLEAINCSPAIPGSGGGWNGLGQVNSGMKNFFGGYSGGLASTDNYGAGGGGAGPAGNGGNAGTNSSPNGAKMLLLILVLGVVEEIKVAQKVEMVGLDIYI